MSDESQHELLLASVDRCLAGDGSAEALRDFAARYFAAASHEILTQRSPEALAAIVCAQHDLVENLLIDTRAAKALASVQANRAGIRSPSPRYQR